MHLKYLYIQIYSGPSASPFNLSYELSSSTNLTFSWEEVPCGQRNNKFIDYDYLFYAVGSSEADRIIGEINGTTITFSELNLCHQYFFAVAASNSLMRGPHVSLTVNLLDQEGRSSFLLMTLKITLPYIQGLLNE